MKNVRCMSALIALTLVLVAAAPGSAGEIVLEAVDSGNYDWEGDHSSGNTAYVAGDLAASGFSERRTFFVFDLLTVEGPILRAAVGAGATHLLTGDVTHFGRFFGHEVAGVLILPPGTYLRSISRSD